MPAASQAESASSILVTRSTQSPQVITWGFFIVVEPGDLLLPFLVGMLWTGAAFPHGRLPAPSFH
ncbi:hypothetical protein [Streptomyces mutabilis]|uniref:Uncharacterized protein n=1 Tax=Streptomyces mutabilis TaxID=67332 RepID=A0A086N0S3_9ACTN|nr:hypothetical protein [Streptomyces mutabilis]KFG74741.1 hypothetical protein FM21_00785 [Streptomyces mutabilis]